MSCCPPAPRPTASTRRRGSITPTVSAPGSTPTTSTCAPGSPRWCRNSMTWALTKWCWRTSVTRRWQSLSRFSTRARFPPSAAAWPPCAGSRRASPTSCVTGKRFCLSTARRARLWCATTIPPGRTRYCSCSFTTGCISRRTSSPIPTTWRIWRTACLSAVSMTAWCLWSSTISRIIPVGSW